MPSLITWLTSISGPITVIPPVVYPTEYGEIRYGHDAAYEILGYITRTAKSVFAAKSHEWSMDATLYTSSNVPLGSLVWQGNKGDWPTARLDPNSLVYIVHTSLTQTPMPSVEKQRLSIYGLLIHRAFEDN